MLSVLARVRARLDEVTDRMVAHYRTGIPAYGDLPPGYFEDVREVSRRNLEIFFSSVEEARGLLEEDLAFIRQGAIRRVEESVPLADLLHAYRSGTRIAWTAVLEELERGTRAEREAGGEFAAALLEYLDEVSTAVEDAYLSKWRTQIHRTALHRWNLANELLADPDPARVHLLANEAGIALADEVLVAALPVEGVAAPEVEEGVPGFMTEIQGRSVFFLDGAIRAEALSALAARVRCPIGLSEPRRWVEGLSASFVEACRTADLAARLGLQGPVPGRTLLAERLLVSDPELARRLFEATFGELGAHDGSGALRETIEAFLDVGGSVVRAAEVLHVHPNTVAYRLNRVRDLGGPDLESSEGRFRAHLALRARRLWHATGGKGPPSGR